MNTWTSALALTVAGALLAGPALAQGTGNSTKQPGAQQPGASGTTQPGMQQPGATGTTRPGMQQPGATGTTRPGMQQPGAPGAAKGERKGQAAASNKQHLRAAQEVLKDRGMYEGEVDGIMGPKTQAALREFQKKEGLQETGRLDEQTMTRLGVEKTGATGATSPAASPPTGAAPKDQPATGAPQPQSQPATPGAPGAQKDSTKKP